MNRLLTLALSLSLSLFLSLCVSAQGITPPPVAARAHYLLDTLSGQALAAQSEDERFEPASLTKLMTAYLVFAALRDRKLEPSKIAGVSEKAWKAGGSRMFIEPGKPVTVGDLLRGMVVQSGNDATIALAEAVAGTEETFAQLMNREAKRLGLRNSNFVNASGLPAANHYATARDMAVLAAALIRDFPDEYALYSQKEFTWNGIAQANRNRLLWLDPTVDGVKTGFTEAAGYCLIASAKRGERRLVSVVMGAQSDALRMSENQKLLNFGFLAYDTQRLYKQGEVVANPEIFKGTSPTVKLGFDRDVWLTLPRDRFQGLKAKLETVQPFRRALLPGAESGDNEVHPRQCRRRRGRRRGARGRAGSRVPFPRMGHDPPPLPVTAMTSPIAHFNGELLPLDQIRISPLDRGFIFGDGVYEVIPSYGGKLLRAREHFRRLQRSMDEIRLVNPHGVEEWIAHVSRLLAHHPGDQSVYIQVTRGVPSKRDHVIPSGITPTVFMMANPLATPSREMVDKGVACVTAKDFRWEKCHIKSTSLLGNVLVRQISADVGATETILFRDGFLTEAAASNVFVVKDGAVAAAPQDNHILLGITYELLTELAREGKIRYDVRPVAEIRGALRRRGLAHLVHEGSARRHHARRQERRRGRARSALSPHARPLPGIQGAPRGRTGGRRLNAGGATMRPEGPEAKPLLTFPTPFPIKVMGRLEEGYAQAILDVVLRHAPDFDPATLEMRPSKAGTYLSLTVTINASSREQLDALYRELSGHPMVVMVL